MSSILEVLRYRFSWLGVVLALCLPLLLGVKPAHAASPGDVLIVEVGADPASAAGIAEPAGEYIEIRNVTGASINLNGWTITDNGITTVTLPNMNLDAGKVLIIIADSTTFNGSNYNCAANPLFFQPTTWFNANLANGNDRVLLRDNSNTLIDAVSYGTDTTAFNPAATDVFDNNGTTLQRTSYPAGPYSDTNAATDWTASTGAGTPCDVSPTAVSLHQLQAENSLPLQPTFLIALALLAATLYLGWKRYKIA